jgi:hypothetical protein
MKIEDDAEPFKCAQFGVARTLQSKSNPIFDENKIPKLHTNEN